MTDKPAPSSLAKIATEYFSTLNPIAAKIQLDIDDIANAYEHLWRTFSRREQADVINEQLIKPDIVLRYFDTLFGSVSNRRASTSGTAAACVYGFNGRNLRTYAAQKCGTKMGQDDLCGMYRDEHSPPFCVKTKSQINFSAFDYGEADVLDGRQFVAAAVATVGTVKCVAATVTEERKLVRKPATPASAPPTATVATHADKEREFPLLMFNVCSSGNGASTATVAGASTTTSASAPNMKSNQNGGNAFLAKLASSMTHRHSNGMAGGEDEETLVANISLGMHSSSSGGGGPSEDDDDSSPQCGEFSSLLENNELTKKGYDFLNNW